MKDFILKIPTRIYFGNHNVEGALRKEEELLCGNIMIVTTGRSLKKYGYLDELKNILDGCPNVEEVIIFDRISANPRLEEIEEAVKMGRDRRVTAIVGFGGGSALDAAKAAAVGIGISEKLERFLLEEMEPTGEVLPIIAIPTTAGSGSELSKGAIVSSLKYRIKGGIRGDAILPKVAIVNPRYTWTLPMDVTMETGFDALAHAIETYTAVKANNWSEMLSEKAIKIIAENLPLLKKNIDNHEAREAMSYASMIMGMNLANIGTCLPHRMQYGVGARTDTSHAIGIAALYPAWIQRQYDVNEKKVKDTIFWLTGKNVQSGKESKEELIEFMKFINVNKSLADLGIKREEVSVLAHKVMGDIGNDKLSIQVDIIENIYNDSL
ncbi:iron-containing alcohol dehydrogenase [Kineothrix sp. MB12-C1]|uniref:iron-containing alcohol dehydrogenase n=1 Tax=Kineothrix sp. MB12-C1 TaxID=3070215 RepID=UPI0027D283C9|nr:iron-containing alcohol dehydrogenase [Kineothrix sp. MB12-C1]WMC93871.1 iron-containing alcohol dehydrogenase [Kineothrix sp. MB12-C1]